MASSEAYKIDLKALEEGQTVLEFDLDDAFFQLAASLCPVIFVLTTWINPLWQTNGWLLSSEIATQKTMIL